MNRAGCLTRNWSKRLQLSRAVERTCDASRLNTKTLLALVREHDRRLPHLLPAGQRVQTTREWAGSRDTLVMTTVCDSRTGEPITLVQFSWEGR